ncbi:MAG: L,D-transpeptidase [Solirubrobacteraceae bacterium]
MRGRLVSLSLALAATIAMLMAVTGAAWADGSTTSASSSTTTSTTTSAPAASGSAASLPSAVSAATGKPTPVPKPKPSPSPSPTPSPTTAVKAAASLSLSHAYFVHKNALTLPGRVVEVQGVVKPYVAGQWVQIVATINRKGFKTDKLRIKPSANGTSGVFTEKISARHAGIVRVVASHARTAQMLGFQARRAFAVINTPGPGAKGPGVDLIQHYLVALHFYLPESGTYDLQTELAVDAYHRLLHRGTGKTLDRGTLNDLLALRGAFKVRDPGQGKHVEGDLGNQLLALINGSKVYRIYPISSGKPSTPTILGHFYVYSRVPGYLPDGMYFSDFFHGGYAIHGYDPAPDYAASHGCMRLPISDALSVWNWLSIGVPVDTYL